MLANYPERFHRYSRYFTSLRSLRQKKTVQAYTMIILSLLTVSFFIFSAIRPTLKTIAGLMAELREKKEIDKKLEGKINALSFAKTNYQQANQDLSLIEEALPPEAEFTLLMIQIETLASKHNVTLEEADFKDINLIFAEETKIQFNLGAAGRYQDLKNFLTDIENLRRITVLESFDLQKPRKAETQALGLKIEAEVQSLKK